MHLRIEFILGRPFFRDVIALGLALCLLWPLNVLINYAGFSTGIPQVTATSFTIQGFVIGSLLGPFLLWFFRARGWLDPFILVVAVIVIIAAVMAAKGGLCIVAPEQFAPYRGVFEYQASLESQCLFFALLNLVMAVPKGLVVLFAYFQIHRLFDATLGKLGD